MVTELKDRVHPFSGARWTFEMDTNMNFAKQTLALALIGAAALPATAENLDPHLSVVLRTTEEQARISGITMPTQDFTTAEVYERMQGGAATFEGAINANAFTHASANLPESAGLDFAVGNGFFDKIWVSSPSATLASNGLGPLYNARSCLQCHPKNGRGHAPENPEENAVSLFLRLSVPGNPEDMIAEIEDYLNTVPDPVYGTQLQGFAVVGQLGEARLGVEYQEIEVPLNGGEIAHLRRPVYHVQDLAYGPLAEGAMLSPRVAPQMIGLGLLEAIPAADILANADEDDKDQNGISGRANWVWPTGNNQPALGRFGHKAGQPDLAQQAADALSHDIGISSFLNPENWGDCTKAQQACRDAPHGGEPIFNNLEIPEVAFDLLAFFSRNLAVPARRNVESPIVLQGKEVFYQSGCVACHIPKFVTHRLQEQGAQSFQLIWPYTDLLLHDMGEGLADHRPESRATGWEWRTAPLWGIGLTDTVSGHSNFLHDGRARTLLEAVLWHGGEAQAARDTVVGLKPENRAALIAFLESL